MIVTIDQDADESDAFNTGFKDITAIGCPAALTGTALSLLGGHHPTAMLPIDSSEFPVITGIVVITASLRGIPYIAIKSNATEAEDRTFTLYLD